MALAGRIAGVAHTVTVAVFLQRVGRVRAVVFGATDAVLVKVRLGVVGAGVTGVAPAIKIGVLLVWVGVFGAVVVRKAEPITVGVVMRDLRGRGHRGYPDHPRPRRFAPGWRSLGSCRLVDDGVEVLVVGGQRLGANRAAERSGAMSGRSVFIEVS